MKYYTDEMAEEALARVGKAHMPSRDGLRAALASVPPLKAGLAPVASPVVSVYATYQLWLRVGAGAFAVVLVLTAGYIQPLGLLTKTDDQVLEDVAAAVSSDIASDHTALNESDTALDSSLNELAPSTYTLYDINNI